MHHRYQLRNPKAGTECTVYIHLYEVKRRITSLQYSTEQNRHKTFEKIKRSKYTHATKPLPASLLELSHFRLRGR